MLGSKLFHISNKGPWIDIMAIISAVSTRLSILRRVCRIMNSIHMRISYKWYLSILLRFHTPALARQTGARPVGIFSWYHQMKTFSTLLAVCAGIHRSPVNSLHKGQWCRAVMFSNWLNNREAGDLRCHCAHYDITVMLQGPNLRCQNQHFKDCSSNLADQYRLVWLVFNPFKCCMI